VGSCVGLRGIRIQNIVNELNGEKIDIVEWHPDQATLIANALSPAQVTAVELNEEERAAGVVVPDRQLSLAIGKEGQNARLAAKLSGWRIDIKSASVAEAEKAALAEEALHSEAVTPVEEMVVEEAVPAEPEETVAEAVEEYAEPLALELEEEGKEVAEELELELGAEEEEEEEEAIPVEAAAPVVKAVKSGPVIRFAEDIMPERRGRAPKRGPKKGKAKAVATKEKAAAAPAKAKKVHRPVRVVADEGDEEGTWLGGG